MGVTLNDTPSANRLHIGVFGKTNSGKSSFINAFTGQQVSIVADVAGTTTDPVYKAMEILPLGPVLLIDTPGLDDTGKLGELRVHKSWQILNKTDIALLVIDERQGISPEDEAILNRIAKKQIPCIIVMNKHDLMPENQKGSLPENTGFPVIEVSASTGYHIPELRELLASVYHVPEEKFRIVGDLLSQCSSFRLIKLLRKED